MNWLWELIRRILEWFLGGRSDGSNSRQEEADGKEVSVRELDLKDDPSVLSPPIVAEPLYRCGPSVTVLGFVPHADIEVEVNGVVIASGVGDWPDPDGQSFALPQQLQTGDVVRARQRVGAVQSDWSKSVTVKDHLADYPAGPPRPEINPAPVYECGSRTGVRNLLRGCKVWITADGTEVGKVEDAQQGEGHIVHQGVNVSPDYGLGQGVVAWASMCGDPSPPSQTHVTVNPPSPLPTPGIEPGYEGGNRIVVNNIVNGARFTVTRGGTVQGTWRGWGGRSYVDLTPAFTAGELLGVTQQLCLGDPPSAEGTTTVQPCSALPAPGVAPIQEGDDQVWVYNFAPGAQIKVYINLVKVGDGGGPVVQLTKAVEHGDIVHVQQVLGTCIGSTVREVTPHCVAPHVTGDPSALNLFPVGHLDYDGGTTDFLGETLAVKGTVYYPAEADGEETAFNSRLSALGKVPIVFIAHGNHGIYHHPENRSLESCAPNPGWIEIPNHKGYDYFQRHLAQMGFIAVGVYSNEGNCKGWDITVIKRRAQIIIGSIEHFNSLDASSDPIFGGRVDMSRVGLMGHSQGGEAVLVVPETINIPGVSIGAVVSLAPVDFGATSGKAQGFAFMTVLPAGDGDVVDNDGAKFYDAADPSPFKSQLYVHHANHNFFNRQWPLDESIGPPVMSREDHERVLSVYGCAFFRASLTGHSTTRFLTGEELPAGAPTHNVHLSYEWENQNTVDHHEDMNGIGVNSLAEPTTQTGDLSADEYQFGQGSGAFNGSFYGRTTGMVAQIERSGDFRSQLIGSADLRGKEVWVRCAEVFTGSISGSPTGFAVGLEDSSGLVSWIGTDEVGSLPRPYDRGPSSKTMLKTLRFPSSCFAEAEPQLSLEKIAAIRLRPQDTRPLGFDVLQTVTPPGP